MEIKQFVWDTVDSNSWLVMEGNSGLLIDAVDNEKLYDAVRGIDELTVILTHAHFDHIIGLNTIRQLKPDIMVVCTETCSEYLGNIYRNMSAIAAAFMKFYEAGKKSEVQIEPFVCRPADKTFNDGLEFNWRGRRIELKAVHGHSDDGLAVIFNRKIMFSGDTLLNMPTVTRFPTGSTKRFWEEDIPMLKKLDVEAVYPGHGMPGKKEDMMAANQRPERFKEWT